MRAEDRREAVYAYVRRRLLAGDPPTLRDVQHAMGFRAVESARKHLDALVACGRLEKVPERARGYRLPRQEVAELTASPRRVPLIGDVQAGEFTTAIEAPKGWVAVDRPHDAGDLFALTVRGDSMVDAGIFEGDVVIVRRQAEARSGDIVVALVEDEATVKTFRRRGGRIELHPANPRYPILTPDPGRMQILGRVVEVRRKL
ncbi:MAG: repressor LexA [Deltaproteobacteria bacterium]|nr:MAG: repressor LexA [Deltaproteobacteria bacterium]